MKESRIYNSTKNIILGIVSQILTLILNFGTKIVFVRILGAEYTGINGLFSNVITILSVAELGMGSAIIYSMYKPLAENDQKRISELMNFYKKIYNIVAITIFIIGIGLVPFIKYLVNTSVEIEHINVYYLLFLINTVASYIFASRTVILNANQKLYIIKIYNFIIYFIQCILQIVILLLTRNFIFYLIVQILSTLIANIVGAIITEKMYPYIKQKSELPKDERKKIFENMKSMLYYKIGGVILNNTDNILISILVGTVWVGYYSNYLIVISAIEAFTTIVFNALTASVGNLVAKSNKDRQFKVFKVINMICNIMFGMCAIELIILFNDFILIAFGNEYVLEKEIVYAIVLLFYIKGILNPIWVYRETTGLFKNTKYIILITAGLNIIFSIVLGKKFGVFGIVLATILARVMTNIWYEPIILYKVHFHQDVKEYFKNNGKNFIITIIIIFICTIVFERCQKINIFIFLIKGIVCMLIAIILYYFVYKNTEEYEYIKKNLFIPAINKIKKG